MTPGFVLSTFHTRGYSEILPKGGSHGVLAEALRGSAENVFAAVAMSPYQGRLDLFEARRTQPGPSCEPDTKRSAPTLFSRVGRCGFRRLHIVQFVMGIANLLSRELTYFCPDLCHAEMRSPRTGQCARWGWFLRPPMSGDGSSHAIQSATGGSELNV